MKKTVLVAFMLLTFLMNSTFAQSSKTTSTSDPDNLAKEYFSQIMGVAVTATTSSKMYHHANAWADHNGRNNYHSLKNCG